ncbi:MAG TPA: DNA polymerase I, partial [Saprospiraceae bacterium]|nr:DNA polymerase I [Saprospiraceae bacterium]
ISNTKSTKSSAGVQQSLFGNDVGVVTPNIPAIPAHSVAEKNITNTSHKYTLHDTPEKRAELIKLLMKEKRVCFDTETTGIDANQAELVGIAFAFKKEEAYYVPFPIDKEKAKELLEEFRPFFESTAIEKIGQNIKYDILMLKWYGIEVKGALFDTMIAHYLLEPELRHNMDYLSETYLKYQPVSISSLIGKKGKKQLNMRDIAVEKVTEYAAEDADITLQLQQYFEPKLKEENLIKLYKEIEEPLINTIVEVEYNGFNIDVDFLNKYAVKLAAEIKEKQKAVFEEAGVNFNMSSPKQVGQVLFEKLKIPYRWRKTSSGQYSTSEEKLTELSHNHSIIKEILRYRGLSKLLNTYVVALPKMVNPRTGRIHSSFNQALAATGRLSSKDPNLQNIPIRTPEGAEVRKAFIPRDKNHMLLAADYSQIELRLIAEMSGDEAMLDAFQKGQDIHAATAAKVFGVPIDEVTREQRYRAKTVNFSVIYGAGATNLSRQLEIKRKEASELIANYFQQYNGLKKYMDQTVKEARENGFVKTLMGRRRYLRDINSRNGLIRSNAERIAINTPIQGSAADMIKIAMINIFEAMKAQNLKSKMILQVHDELVFDAHKDELEILKPLIEDKMKNAIPNLKVPILVSIGEGQNWLEAH